MANKSKELDCIKKVIKCKYHIGEFASGIHSILFARKELIDCTGESPDIIINDDSEIIGIEHFQADMLFSIKRKKAQSLIMISGLSPVQSINSFLAKRIL